MELKTLKDQLGEPLGWSDYLSLPFTQNVSKYIAEINSLQYIINSSESIYILCSSHLLFYVQVITETLRMGNIIIGVMRKAMKDVEIKGYLIPKGWCVFTYFRSVHLDENNFDGPYDFNPWRWQVRIN